MPKSARFVYQFRIQLDEVSPPIWRRIQVPQDYSFWDLHVAIQDSMGWQDYHLHEFRVIDPRTNTERVIGLPDDEGWDEEPALAGWEHAIADYFSIQNPNASYTYDFGDDWHHSVELEQILPRTAGKVVPLCIAGAGLCPPEDCGGPEVYTKRLKRRKSPEKAFDPALVHFDDPRIRLRNALH